MQTTGQEIFKNWPFQINTIKQEKRNKLKENF